MRFLKSMLCSLLGKQNVVPRPEDKDHLRILYFQAGLQYQIAGRCSAIAWFSPVSGNLLHHAIEFYLKGALIKILDERARRKIGHDVGKLWRRYKREIGDTSLDRFDQTIADLNKFERIRYPE